jgi:hypothetical protein
MNKDNTSSELDISRYLFSSRDNFRAMTIWNLPSL